MAGLINEGGGGGEKAEEAAETDRKELQVNTVKQAQGGEGAAEILCCSACLHFYSLLCCCFSWNLGKSFISHTFFHLFSSRLSECLGFFSLWFYFYHCAIWASVSSVSQFKFQQGHDWTGLSSRPTNVSNFTSVHHSLFVFFLPVFDVIQCITLIFLFNSTIKVL